MERRRFLGAAAAAGTVALAGCSNVQPDPVVVSSNAESQLFGPTTIDVTVQNEAAKGDVNVVVKIFGSGETVQSKHTETVTMSEGAKREVTFNVDLEQEAEKYTATAKAAGFI
ncbi:twin-arginine translocation signal domain-containing protein [Halorarius halobius]|uniref:twin-arginine translocation signal domain-containing protein n=1 Tax=Halorarius halobius TaxID=2962671 RepID=UPI0020CDCD93|nr:twin-arginine translocation signal domain-containing protein [Halorarius halobius]